MDFIKKVKNDGLTYLDEDALKDLYFFIQDLEKKNIKGDIVEAGCALGGSTIILSKAKHLNRKLLVYDIFDMIPEPSKNDGSDVRKRYNIIKKGNSKGIKGNTYYGYEKNLLKKVENTLKNYNAYNNVYLIKGKFNETLYPKDPIAIAHIDCDWYESVKVALNRIYPFIVKGGRFIIDDYFHWSGCKKAVEEFLQNHPEFKKEKYTRLHLIYE